MPFVRKVPFRSLAGIEKRMYQVFEDAFDRAFRGKQRDAAAAPASENAWTPAVDVFEDGDTITLRVALPRIDPDRVSLRLENDTLSLGFEQAPAPPQDVAATHRPTQTLRPFRRSFTPGALVETDSMNASYREGTFVVTFRRR